jgi:cytochrome P450/NADPH-cytochrome P450 reductase
LQVKQTLTLKPQNFKFRAIPRKDAPSFSVIAASPLSSTQAEPVKRAAENGTEKGIPLNVLYGSNSGSCEGFAQIIASKAAGKGTLGVSANDLPNLMCSFAGFCVKIDSLDSAANNIPKDGPVVIVTASFEGRFHILSLPAAPTYKNNLNVRYVGEPADNAGHFVKALTTTADVKDLDGVSFAVFGAGNHDWAQTYQRIPRLIDGTLEKKGGKRLLELGEGDAGGGSFIESFNEWEEKLWETLAQVSGHL